MSKKNVCNDFSTKLNNDQIGKKTSLCHTALTNVLSFTLDKDGENRFYFLHKASLRSFNVLPIGCITREEESGYRSAIYLELTITVRLGIDADSGGFRISIKWWAAHPNPKIRRGRPQNQCFSALQGPKNKVGAWAQDPPLYPPWLKLFHCFASSACFAALLLQRATN